ncbi:MAG: hypothetical protein V3574_05360 [Candidatus Moraniibacteriota bacterium]
MLRFIYKFKFLVYFFIIFLNIFILSERVLATPTITNVSGDLTDNNSITISGTDFGISGPTIKVFDDFESGEADSFIGNGTVTPAVIGNWEPCDDCYPYLSSYSNNFAKSGTKSSRQNWTTDMQGGGRLMILKWIIPVTEIYFSFWTYLPSGMSTPDGDFNSPNWKVWWLNPIHYGESDPRNFDSDYASEIITNPPADTSFCWVDDLDGQDRACANYSSFNFSNGQWQRFEGHLIGSDSSSGSGELWLTNASSSRVLHASISGKTLNTSNGIMGWIEMHFPGYARADTTTNTYYDDIYVATGVGAQARIEIGNASTYSNCTNLSIVTPTAWADTSITATIRQGSFSPGQQAYLYVVDSNGVANTNGYPIIIGENGMDISAPEAPSGLLIF